MPGYISTQASDPRTIGALGIASNFEVEYGGPFDARLVVKNKTQLEGLPYPYAGMIVCVAEDNVSAANNGIYYLSATGTNPIVTGDWIQVSGGGGSISTYKNGVLITNNTAGYDFLGAGITSVVNNSGIVEVTIPGGGSGSYSWTISDGSNSSVVSSGDSVILSAGSGINITESNKTVVINSTTPVLTHDKMWSGSSLNKAQESDILEASNMADGNKFTVVGNTDTVLELGTYTNPINLEGELYTHQLRSVVLGYGNYNYGGQAPSEWGTVCIGYNALEKFAPGSLGDWGSNVVIGASAQNETGAGAYIRNSVVIGASAGHNAYAGSNYVSVVIGYDAGHRVSWRDVIIGAHAGNAPGQGSTGAASTTIGFETFAGANGVNVGGYSSNYGNGVTVGVSAYAKASASNNVIVGNNVTGGFGTVAVGNYASSNSSGVSVGHQAGRYWDEDGLDSTVYNTFIGANAGAGDASGAADGSSNVAIGESAMRYAGYDGGAGLPAVPAERNVCIGYMAGRYLRSNSNIAIGYKALYNYNNTHWSNDANVVIGDEAAYHNEDGSDNVYIGSEVAQHITSGDENVAIGSHAGWGAMNQRNVCIGWKAQYADGAATNLVSNVVTIGQQSICDHSIDEAVNAVAVGSGSICSKTDTVLGANAKGAPGGIALGYGATLRNKGQAPNPTNQSFEHLWTIGPDTASGFNVPAEGSAQRPGGENYCFYDQGEAEAAGLKHGDIYVLADGVGSSTPANPAILCIVLTIVM